MVAGIQKSSRIALKVVRVLIITFVALFAIGWSLALLAAFLPSIKTELSGLGIVVVVFSFFVLDLMLLVFARRVVQLVDDYGRPRRIRFASSAKRLGLENAYPVDTPPWRLHWFAWGLRAAGTAGLIGIAVAIYWLIRTALKAG
jgi:hypothetical protein